MSKKRPKLVWVVMLPGQNYGFGYSKRKFALWFKRGVQADRRTRFQKIYKRLKVVRVVMQG